VRPGIVTARGVERPLDMSSPPTRAPLLGGGLAPAARWMCIYEREKD